MNLQVTPNPNHLPKLRASSRVGSAWARELRDDTASRRSAGDWVEAGEASAALLSRDFRGFRGSEFRIFGCFRVLGDPGLGF